MRANRVKQTVLLAVMAAAGLSLSVESAEEKSKEVRRPRRRPIL